jgi:(1->4)-alpha-D-glucan 1-alpha-D-glucosylmutase
VASSDNSAGTALHQRPITATYRLQFNRSFTFADAAELVPYFVSLGVSHLYASPIFASRPGSTHGYDVVDPTRISPELGGGDGFRAFAAAARVAGLGLVLDIVPNHMAADRHNPTWMETLCLGKDAPAAGIYDIDWSRDKIALPVLGGSLEDCLARGEIAIACDREDGWLVASYFDHVAPLRPKTVAAILEAGAERLPASAHRVAARWRSLERNGGADALEEARAALRFLAEEAGNDFVNILAAIPAGDVLPVQHWRLDDWRLAASDLTYRRFFNIVELVGVRVEEPWVFDWVHSLPLSLVEGGLVDGLRVDHVDGLADPAGYCARLRQAAGRDALIVVEKILEGDERLPPWPVDGTTGYERLNDINGLLVDPAGCAALDRHLVSRGLLSGTPHERLARTKRQVVEEMFGSEVSRLVALASACLVESGWEGQPPGEDAIRRAVLGLCVHCPVYRTYITPAGHDRHDELVWKETLAALAQDGYAQDVDAQDGDAQDDHPQNGDEEAAALADRLVDMILAGQASTFATGLQQLTGPAMAKGLEDTEFYRSVGLLSVNEVGGDLTAPAMPIERFHERTRAALERRDLVPLATHDTKRSADVRARISMISADPEKFIAHVSRWEAKTSGFLQGNGSPDALDRWMILQTLVGAWPISPERMEAFVTKALREAKRHTRWEAPEPAYESAAVSYARVLIESEATADVRSEIEDFIAAINTPARIAGLAQVILQTTVPGIPDIYQGTEMWDHSLVDPDNRRAVDWAARRLAVTGIIMPPLAQDGIGLSKIILLRRLLTLRRRHPGFFAEASYEPADVAEGPGRYLAFVRRQGASALLVAVPTRPTGLVPGGTTIQGLPDGTWRNVVNDQAFETRHWGTPIDRSWPFLLGFQQYAGGH